MFRSSLRRRGALLSAVVVAAVIGADVVLVGPASAASLTVTSTADVATNFGACGSASTTPTGTSLREAVCAANNAGAASSTITVAAGTYVLTNGELQMGKVSGSNITLNGAGSGSTIISGNNASRVFDLDPSIVGGVTTSISGVTITKGTVTTFGGAGIIAGSGHAATKDVLTLSNSTVSNNTVNSTQSNRPGGGLEFQGGALTVTNTTFSGNTSGSSSGSAVAYDHFDNAPGEQLTISGATFTGNFMSASVDNVNVGGALHVDGISLTPPMVVSNSVFTGNTVTGSGTGIAQGGAIFGESGSLTVTGSTFTGNSVTGGAQHLGGAVSVVGGTAQVHYNRITGNIGTDSGVHLGVSSGASLDASNNWWGCNTGPNTAGCDGAGGGGPAPNPTPVLTPRLVLTATATPAALVGPNAVSTITAALTTNSDGTAVSAANLSAFQGLPVGFNNLLPSGATVSAASGNLSSGSTSTSYNSQNTSGPGRVDATLDNGTATTLLTVNRPPAITSGNATSFTVGTAGSFTVTTTGYPGSTVTRTGTVPPGLAFVDNGNGTATLSGTPTAGGSYPLSLTANNGINPNATQTLTVTVTQAPAFTSANTATFTTGTAGSFTVTTTPTAYPTPVTITKTTGTVPSGLTFTDNGDGTATLSGTPAAGSGGAYPLSLKAANGITPNGTQNLTVTVNQAPAVTTNPSDQTVDSGASVSFIAAASGFPNPTVQWQRSTNGGGTYTNIAGATSPTYTFTAASADNGNKYRAVFTNSTGTATSEAATLVVHTAPTISSANTTSFSVGTAGSFTVTTTGLPNATLTTTGTLPAWLSFTGNGDGTATLAGTAPVGSGGQYSFTINADNGTAPSDSQAFTLSANESPTITSADHTTFPAGTAGNFLVTTTAGFPVATTLTKTGSLPSGVTFADNGNGTASLAGAPAAGTAGSYPITIKASNGATTDATQSFTLTVTEAPVITSTDHTTFVVGTPGTFTVTTAGGAGSVTVTKTAGNLPSGVTFTDNGDGTATLAGTPAAGTGGSYPLTITASDGVNTDATQSFTLTVQQPPAITSADHDTFSRGVAGSFTVTTAPGVPASTTITKTGSLPAGVTFTDNGDGTATVAGTPTGSGSFPITITASNGVAPDSNQAFTLTVNQAPDVTSVDHTTFTVGTAGTFTVTTTPAADTVAQTGTLPSGVSFTDNGDGTATLAGTPAAGTGGVYGMSVKATNATGSTTQSFTLTINEKAGFTSADHTTFVIGTASSFTVTTTAGYPVATTVTKTGPLPAGVSFTDNGDGTATIAGTPAAGTDNSYPLTIDATNAAGPRSQSFTLTVVPANASPVITSADHTTFAFGAAGTFTVTTTHGYPTATTVSKTGSLPAGVSFTDNGDGSATLAGTPTAAGAFPITLTASNGATTDATQSFVLTVTKVPAVTSADHTTFVLGTAGSFTVTTAAGYPVATAVTETGSLPSGVTFTDNGDGTATLAGTAAAGTAGSYPLTITAANSAGSSQQSYTLTVTEAPSITSADHTTFTVGSAGTFTVTTSPAAATISKTGSLPTGVTFTDNDNGTATLAGTPAAGTGGIYTLSLSATNASGTGTQSFTLTVNEQRSITSSDHTTFVVGTAGSFTVTTAAGYPTATTLTRTGTLPAGVTFTDNGDGTATLAGTPDAGSAASYPLTITATNAAGLRTQSFTLTAQPANASPVITSADHTTFSAGNTGTFTVKTAAGYPTATTLSETETLPAGVSFTDNGDGTATLAGTPTETGAFTVTLAAGNGAANDGTQSFTLTVTQAPSITSGDHTTLTIGSAGTVTVTSKAGYPTATTVSEAGTLPIGVTFTDNGDGTGTLTGTPAAGSAGSYPLTITAANTAGSSQQSFSLTVVPANASPVITSDDNATFAKGSAGTFQVTTTAGYPAATTITPTGTLPAGVTFTDNHDGTATLAGTPTTSGPFPLTITASNGATTDATQSFTLTVTQKPMIVSQDRTTFTAGSAAAFTVSTAAGYPTATTLTSTGTMPAGVTFTDNGNGTASLAGTPASGAAGSYPLSLTASNTGGSSQQSFTLTVVPANAPPAITSADHATFVNGSAGTFKVTTTAGYPTATTITETGTLPAGVTFTDNGDGTATLAGTPTAAGAFPITITAGNPTTDATQNFTLTVTKPPVLTSADHTTFVVGSAGTFTVTTTAGYPTATNLTKAGTLPAGVTFTDNGNGTATLAGAPGAGTAGSYPLTITAANTAGSTAQPFTLTVVPANAPPVITSVDHAVFAKGTAGTFKVTTTPGYPTTTTLTSSGTLPAGLTFNDNHDGTATLAGTPTAAGAFPITITAGNGTTNNATQKFTLTVNAPPAISSANTTTIISDLAGQSFTITTTPGYPTVTTLSESGTLPTGMTFNDNHNGTATLAGTPSIPASSSYPITIQASNGISPNATQTFTLKVSKVAAVPLPKQAPKPSGRLGGVPDKSYGNQPLSVTGNGYKPGAPIQLGWYYSSGPGTKLEILATGYANATGTFNIAVTIPNNNGAKTLAASGLGSDGKPRFLTAATVVNPQPAQVVPLSVTSGSVLPGTGFTSVQCALGVGGLGLLALGHLLVRLARNRTSG